MTSAIFGSAGAARRARHGPVWTAARLTAGRGMVYRSPACIPSSSSATMAVVDNRQSDTNRRVSPSVMMAMSARMTDTLQIRPKHLAGDARANSQTGVPARSGDRAGNLLPRRKRTVGTYLVHAVDHEQIGKIERCGLDPNKNFIAGRNRHRSLDQRKRGNTGFFRRQPGTHHSAHRFAPVSPRRALTALATVITFCACDSMVVESIREVDAELTDLQSPPTPIWH